jgi:hypothetical protein
MTLLLPLMLLTLPVCAMARAPASTLPGAVTYEVRSWGQIMLRWQINPDGTGEIWRKADDQHSGLVRKFHLRLESDALRTFMSDVEEARVATRRGIHCRKQIYDLPYGTITWDYPGAKQEYHFDAGCQSQKGDEAQDILTAATTVVETMAKVDADPYATDPAR